MERKYEIVLKNETSSKSDKSPIAGGGTQSTDTSAPSSGKNNNSSGQVVAAKTLVAVNTYITPFVDSMVTQRVSTIALRTGAQEEEERIAFAYGIAKQGVNFGMSVAVGAMIGGSKFGPLGAVIGGALSLVNTAISYAHQQQKINYAHTVEDIGLRFVNARAGGSVASYSGSRMNRQ